MPEATPLEGPTSFKPVDRSTLPKRIDYFMPKARRSGHEGQRPESRRNGRTLTHTHTRYPWSWLGNGTRSETRSEVWQGNEASERISYTRGPRYKRAAFSHWSLAIGRLSQTRRRPRFTSPITSPRHDVPLLFDKPIATLCVTFRYA